ncbi:DUF1492 domain-containing protein [Clostridium sp. MB40-C1]|uniref:DUF1492 domain-containing protein n=1 Tax=Clostridium sp. MB40-C1 TaxID=3070996 RepID=UPI0027DF6849|nr:DUF1492 domain-containing protein [Clostridium sp. MB40-C1]WMJ80965.1 DUF1492 domain-containing protein [Clostridium sp. MB40-C1]
MNYINEAMEYLTSYKDLKIAIENLNEKEIKLNERLYGLRSGNFNGMPKGKSVEADDILVNTIFQLDQTRKFIKETEDKIKEIDDVLKNLKENDDTEEYEKLLRLWYIEDWTKIAMTEEFNCSDRQLYRIRAKAIRKLAIQLFGIKVIA